MNSHEKLDAFDRFDTSCLAKIFSNNCSLGLLRLNSSFPEAKVLPGIRVKKEQPVMNVYGRPLIKPYTLSQIEKDGTRYLNNYHRALYQFIVSLRPELQKVVFLRLYHGLSADQIATLIHVPLNTVKTLLQEGFDKIVVEQCHTFPCNPFEPALRRENHINDVQTVKASTLNPFKHTSDWLYLLDRYLKMEETLEEMFTLYHISATCFAKKEIYDRITDAFCFEHDLKMLYNTSVNDHREDITQDIVTDVFKQDTHN